MQGNTTRVAQASDIEIMNYPVTIYLSDGWVMVCVASNVQKIIALYRHELTKRSITKKPTGDLSNFV